MINPFQNQIQNPRLNHSVNLPLFRTLQNIGFLCDGSKKWGLIDLFAVNLLPQKQKFFVLRFIYTSLEINTRNYESGYF